MAIRTRTEIANPLSPNSMETPLADESGRSVAAIADVDGDDYADIPHADNRSSNSRAVHVLPGRYGSSASYTLINDPSRVMA